jgi:hypothetical protein
MFTLHRFKVLEELGEMSVSVNKPRNTAKTANYTKKKAESGFNQASPKHQNQIKQNCLT